MRYCNSKHTIILKFRISQSAKNGSLQRGSSFHLHISHLWSSRPPKKDFVEVTELTDVTYTSNLVKLRPGHINIVLVLTNASKTALLRKFAKEVFSFSG